MCIIRSSSSWEIELIDIYIDTDIDNKQLSEPFQGPYVRTHLVILYKSLGPKFKFREDFVLAKMEVVVISSLLLLVLAAPSALAVGSECQCNTFV